MSRSLFRTGGFRRLDSLPTEILVEILSLLDAPEIATCRLLCRRFDDIVCSNARLQYPIHLELANCVDDHPDHPSPVGVRLKRLLARQEAWKAQDFRKKRQLSSSTVSHTPSASAYRSGVLVFGVLNHTLLHPAIQPQVADILGLMYINELHVLFLHGAGHDLDHRRHSIVDPGGFSDFELEPSQDLLVLWDSYSPAPDGLRLRFLSLHEGTRHKRAKTYDMVIPATHFYPVGGRPEDLWIFDMNSIQLNGELVSIYAVEGHRILVLNWVTGYSWSVPGSSCCTLSKDCLIVANCRCNPPHFDVYRITYSVEPPTISHVRRTNLPRVQEGVMRSIDCKPSPSSHASTSAVSSEKRAVPFSTAPDSAMVVFNFRLRVPDTSLAEPDKQLALLCYTPEILSAVRSHVPKTPERRLGIKVVEWERWGPNSSFFLGDVTNDDNVWSYALYGYRLMLNGTIYDFNPHTVKSATTMAEGREGDGPGSMHICKGTSFEDARWFVEKIQTNRPYLWAPIQDSKVPASTSCFLVDEDILALEDATESNSEQVVITQLTVGPEWDAC
ncbi:uncharacterized protein B0H18DRAFT_644556 [Fomitopsis serialis]|uniref:uncharacterized protein n=1 Tax=Fomitopsis serialis TaxID=139415 RepID=UPI002008B7FB|nr:uncharacterized protein B0H18DRAFT_644556 [Neoantrodia serialis]KAH9933414.1 hypothetical protein B0H18DRAFT_644556 [Neoantrodia serialis]